MRIFLPKPQITVTALRNRKYFPSIFRFIPEYTFSRRTAYYGKLIIISFAATLLCLGIIQQSMTIDQNVQKLKQIRLERQQIAKEIRYLQTLEGEYAGYRDMYYRIAVLEYKLGDINHSKQYIQKALAVDPNFREGRVLGEKIGF